LTFARQGVLGIQVKIMLPWDPVGKNGPKKPLPDHVTVSEPKEEVVKDYQNPALTILPGVPGMPTPHKGVDIMPDSRVFE